MKFVQVHTFYQRYLEKFYKERPGLARAPHAAHIEALVRDGFSGIHMFAPYMGEAGHEGHLIVANCGPSQLQWAREHGVRFTDPPGQMELARIQIEILKPDVLYLSDPIAFDGRFLRSLSWKPALVLGWRAAPIPKGTDWTGFDVILSALGPMREIAPRLGARAAERFMPAYPSWINAELGTVGIRHDVVFSGSCVAGQHDRRNAYLDLIARAAGIDPGFKCGYYLSGDLSSVSPETARLDQGGVFGLDMHRALLSGKIAFDSRSDMTTEIGGVSVDLAGKDTANMRIFEATGAGVFLLTEHHENLNRYFTPGAEVETFRDGRELVEKIRYYLDHPEEREAIARAGMKRCLGEHSMPERVKEFDAIIRKHLSRKGQGITGPRSAGPNTPRDSLSVMMAEAQTALGGHDYARALRLFVQAAAVAPDSPEALMGYASALRGLGREEEARRAARRLLSMNPNHAEALQLIDDPPPERPAAGVERIEWTRIEARPDLSNLKEVARHGRFGHWEVLLDGFRIHCHDLLSLYVAAKDIFLRKFYDFECDRPDPRVIDGGGHIGLFTLYVKRKYPRARVTIFEPDEESIGLLKMNLQANGIHDAVLVDAGLYKRDGRLSFSSDGSDGSTFFSDAATTTIRVEPLSRYLEGPVDYLKLNIEGAELDVLEEARDKLRHVKEMTMEYHGFPEIGQNLHRILSILDERGFRYMIHDFDAETNDATKPPFRLDARKRFFLLVHARQLGGAANARKNAAAPRAEAGGPDLARTEPVSRQFGFDRGTPVDRYYIERFLDANRALIRGRVLEIGDDSYTREYGSSLEKVDVLNATPSPNATIVAIWRPAGTFRRRLSIASF